MRIDLILSYVIQNFSKNNNKIIFTPRFKIFLVLKWINLFMFFFKFNNFYKNYYNLNSFFLFFFKKGIYQNFYKILINLSGNYVNRLTVTGVYWNFKSVDQFLTKSLFKKTLKISNFFLFNLYFLSIKIINIKLNNSFFKNFFFYILFFFSEIWYQFNNNWSVYFNFFFVKNNFKFYKFYTGYFLKLNNF